MADLGEAQMQAAAATGQSAALAPQALQALLQRSRFLDRSSASTHLPFLFWLAECLRPQAVVSLGLKNPSLYFSLCQAAERQDMPAEFTGYGTWEDKASKKPGDVPEDIRKFNQSNFAHFSSLVSLSPKLALQRLSAGSVDLLVLDLSPGPDFLGLMLTEGLGKLSQSGVLVVHGTRTRYGSDEGNHFLKSLVQSYRTIAFDDGDGLLVVLCGEKQPRALLEVTGQQHDRQSGAIAARSLFRRAGQLHAELSRGQGLEKSEREAKKKLEDLVSEIGRLNARQFELEQAHDARNREIATAREQNQSLSSENAALRQEVDRLSQRQATLESELGAAVASTDTLVKELASVRVAREVAAEKLRTLEEQLAQSAVQLTSLQREHDELQAQSTAARSSYEERLTQLGAENEWHRGEVASLRTNAEDLSAQVDYLRSELAAETEKALAAESEAHGALEAARLDAERHQAAIADLQVELAQKTASARQWEQDLRAAEAAASKATEERDAALKNARSTSNEDVEALKRELEQRQDEFVRATRTLTETRTVLAAAEQKAREHSAALTLLNEEKRLQKQELDALTVQLRRQTGELGRSAKETQKALSEFGNLKKYTADLERRHLKIRNSSGWKFFAPLRWLGRLLTGKKHPKPFEPRYYK